MEIVLTGGRAVQRRKMERRDDSYQITLVPALLPKGAEHGGSDRPFSWGTVITSTVADRPNEGRWSNGRLEGHYPCAGGVAGHANGRDNTGRSC